VEVVGEHGDAIPVSVTVTFLCEASYYVAGGGDSATCQHANTDNGMVLFPL
jgi:hypothetical protein